MIDRGNETELSKVRALVILNSYNDKINLDCNVIRYIFVLR